MRRCAYPIGVSSVLLCVELSITLTAVILFGLAYPDRSRTKLWEYGGFMAWNSDPTKRIYFYANHREPPAIPLIWSQSLTNSNLAIAIVGLVVVVARLAMTYLGTLSSFVSIVYDIILEALWILSLVGQISGDVTDAKHPSSHPWYLTRTCSAVSQNIVGDCRLAQASFVISVFSVVFYIVNLLWTVADRAYHHRLRKAKSWTGSGTLAIYHGTEYGNST